MSKKRVEMYVMLKLEYHFGNFLTCNIDDPT